MTIRHKKSVSWLGLVLGCLISATAESASFLGPDSEIELKIGNLPAVTVSGSAGSGIGGATISPGGGSRFDVSLQPGVFSAMNVPVGTTPSALPSALDGLVVTLENAGATFTSNFGPVLNNVGVGTLTNTTTPNLCPGGCLGATAPLNGQMLIDAAGSPSAVIGLTAIGSPITTSAVVGSGAPFVVEGQQWLTGKIRITNVTTNIISVSGMQGVHFTLNPPPTATVVQVTTMGGNTGTNPAGVPMTTGTVIVGGVDQIVSTVTGGDVTLVSPLRINTGNLGLGTMPGAAFMRLAFVPEPGTLLTLSTGALALLWMGRRRQRR